MVGLRGLLLNPPGLVVRRSVHIVTDSQAAHEDCWHLRITPMVFQAVCEMRLLAGEHDIALSFT